MATSWIKMGHNLAEKPEVIYIARSLNIHRNEAVGLLHHFWCWVDQNSADGHIKCVTRAGLDEVMGYENLSQALCDVGWLEVEDSGLSLPNFDRHNGESAKKRAMATGRKQKSRQEKPDETPVTSMSRTQRDTSVTREDKIRIDNTPPAREREAETEQPPEAFGEPPVTLDAAKAFAPQAGVTPDIAEKWWLNRDSRGWLQRDSDQPIKRWQSDLKSFALTCNEISATRGGNGARSPSPAPLAKPKPIPKIPRKEWVEFYRNTELEAPPKDCQFYHDLPGDVRARIEGDYPEMTRIVARYRTETQPEPIPA